MLKNCALPRRRLRRLGRLARQRQQRLKIVVRQIHPVARFVWLNLVKVQVTHRVVRHKTELFFSRFHLRAAHVMHPRRSFVFGSLARNGRAFDHKADRHAGLDAKHVVFGAAQFWVGAHVAAQIDHVNIGKLLRHGFTETVKRAAFNKTAVGDKGQNAVFIEPVAGPAEKAGVHVVQLGFLRRTLKNIGLLDTGINLRVHPVFIVVVFIGLVGVVGRVANDDADAAAVLALDAGDVFFTHAAKQVGAHAFGCGVQAHVVQRVNKAQVGKLFVAASQCGKGRLNVQIRHVIRQDGHFVGVQLMAVLVRQLFRLAAKVLQQLANKGTRASGRVQNVHVLVDQVFAKVLFTQPVGSVDHEANHLIGRVHHPQPVSRLGVVDLVKIFVDDF